MHSISTHVFTPFKTSLLFSCFSFASTSLVFIYYYFFLYICFRATFLFSPPYGKGSDDVRLKLFFEVDSLSGIASFLSSLFLLRIRS